MGLLRRLIDRLPCQDVGDGKGSIFFLRYTLLKTRWFAVYLHEFYRGDLDRCLHDHPWDFVSVILRGGYWEHVTFGAAMLEGATFDASVGPTSVRFWRKPGSILRRPAEFAHRIELDPDRPHPWSLVFVGRKRRKWGFYETEAASEGA